MRCLLKKIYFLFIICLLCIYCFAQKENNLWYFGNGAGLDFSSGIPISLTNGNLYTEEGCATVCDSNGNLLFYTNGVKVWNKNHDVMPNGTLLHGHISSTQSALIAKKTNSSSQYYIFTVTEKGGQQGLCYSIVDMTKDRYTSETRIKTNALKTPDIDVSFGNGDVVVKNQSLLNYTSEKLVAVAHKNGKDIWVITHKWNSNEFFVFPITDNGIGKPVISAIGSYHRDFGSKNNGESIGYIAISPNGKKLASAMCYSTNASIELFDFNNETGIISNLQEIQTGGFAYGACFSPDNSKLYVSFLKGAIGVKQYDITVEDPFDSEEIIVRSSPESFLGAMQRGPDGKIYIAKVGSSLDVIMHPNNVGNKCGYSANEINLLDRYAVYGLPNPVVFPNEVTQKKSEISKDNFFSESNTLNINLGNDTIICGESIVLNAKINKADYIWSTGETTQSIRVNKTGQYWIKVIKNKNIGYDTINITISSITENPIKLKKQYDIACEDTYVLDCGVDGAKYSWSTKETSKQINVKESDYYEVSVYTNGCEYKQKTYVNFISQPSSLKYLREFEPQNPIFNNYFAITINDVESFELKIYNPKGKLIFISNSQTNKWQGRDENGKILPKGEYSWELTFKPICGSKIKKEKGTVKLIS